MLKTACGFSKYTASRMSSPSNPRGGLTLRHSHVSAEEGAKITIPDSYAKKEAGQPIVASTAHDSMTARSADRGGVDVSSVGDSLAMVAMGFESTTEITSNDMIYHTRAVRRGAKRPFLVSDSPFGSYEQGPDQASESSIRMMKEGHAECVKFEGSRELVPTVQKSSSYGLATMPHIGSTPQRQIQTGGFKVQGRTASSAFSVLEDALALQEAGATMSSLEGVPARIGAEISRQVSIPVIGIGAGPQTHGQVLVQLDMLGGFDTFTPKFVKKYADSLNYGTGAIREYAEDVRQHRFPGKDHLYTMNSEEYSRFTAMVEKLREK